VHTDWSGGDADAGAALFVAQCSVCHGPNGSGDGPGAIALNPKPRDFRDGTFYLDANANNETGEDVDLARVILEGPGAFGGSNAMTGWKNAFNDDEVRDVVAYIRTLESR
jgi:mono/diheme cytochrome c family protein